MNSSSFSRLAGLGLALLLCSCPGDSDISGPGQVTKAVDASLNADSTFDGTLEDLSQEIQSASEAATLSIDDENADAALEQLMKDLEDDQ